MIEPPPILHLIAAKMAPSALSDDYKRTSSDSDDVGFDRILVGDDSQFNSDKNVILALDDCHLSKVD